MTIDLLSLKVFNFVLLRWVVRAVRRTAPRKPLRTGFHRLYGTILSVFLPSNNPTPRPLRRAITLNSGRPVCQTEMSGLNVMLDFHRSRHCPLLLGTAVAIR